MKKYTSREKLTYALSYLAVLSLLIVGIYIVFFSVFTNNYFVQKSQIDNINGKKNLELSYDPLVTVVPKNMQTASTGKFLISQADPRRGSTNPKVIIYFWSRFDNTEAAELDQKIEEIRGSYSSEEILVVWKDFVDPKNTEEVGLSAALAAQCANEQGKFWEYHDLLYANVADLQASNLSTYATQLNLDDATFNSCYTEKKMQAIISSSYYLGKNNGVESAPALYVNDQKIDDITDTAAIKEVINNKIASYSNE